MLWQNCARHFFVYIWATSHRRHLLWRRCWGCSFIKFLVCIYTACRYVERVKTGTEINLLLATDGCRLPAPWIRIRIRISPCGSGSGSRRPSIMRIQADPDPQHCSLAIFTSCLTIIWLNAVLRIRSDPYYLPDPKFFFMDPDPTLVFSDKKVNFE